MESSPADENQLSNLRKLVLRLEWGSIINEDEMDAFVELLSYCHNLTELDIPGDVLYQDNDVVEHFLKKMEQLPKLQRLAFGSAYIDAWVAHRLLIVCFKHPQLVDLQCDSLIGDFRYPIVPASGVCDPRFATLLKSLQEADKKKADAGEPTGLRLKSLCLPRIKGGYPQDFLFPFLRSHVPHLERLDVPHIRHDYDVRVLKDVILRGCPRLQHVSTHCLTDDSESRCGVMDVIRHCVPLD